MQHELGLAQVADDPSARRRLKLDQGRRHEDAIVQSALRVAEDVHQLDLVLFRQIRATERGKIGDRLHGVQRAASYIQTKLVYGKAAQSVFPFRRNFGASAPRSSLMRTFRTADSRS
jgi:hypothetical protein